MISCSDAVNQLWQYLDGTVEAEQRAAIEEHLSFCRRCCGEVEFAEELRGFLARSARDEVPPDVIARLTATLEELEGR
jgi:mycothiol system anti-sigma-R factor